MTRRRFAKTKAVLLAVVTAAVIAPSSCSGAGDVSVLDGNGVRYIDVSGWKVTHNVSSIVRPVVLDVSGYGNTVNVGFGVRIDSVELSGMNNRVTLGPGLTEPEQKTSGINNEVVRRS